METQPIKKRRNSILKKQPPNEEDTTGDITTKIKRRISFSGKKSVKEFIAGEEEATIWGTSYEESAESLQANSTETGGLVNVNEKRIVLRNRRVVVNPDQQQKRRSRNKALVAANDKENMFVPEPTVQLPAETNKVQDTPKVASPVKSESPLTKGKHEDAKTQTWPEPLDCVNICSNTFDFINISNISKTITIDRSVDVTLNENELQMFKFRVPVAATDVTPNSSTSLFSGSIKMTEEDKQMLKMLRDRNAPRNAAVEIEAKDKLEQKLAAFQAASATIANVVDMEESIGGYEATLLESTENKAQHVRGSLCANQPMNVIESELSDGGATLRKTILNAENIEANGTINQKSSTVDSAPANGSENKSKQRATIHMSQSMNFSQHVVTETRNLKRKTITKRENMQEVSLRMDLSVKPQTKLMDSSSMDINSPLRKKPMHNATSKPMDVTGPAPETADQIGPTRRQTIHFESAEMDASAFVEPGEEAVFDEALDVFMEESIAPSSIYNAEKHNRNRHTIHDTGDVRMDVTTNPQNQHALVGTHANEAVMQHSKASKASIVRRQTVYDAEDIAADAPLPSVNMESAANFRPIEESKPSVIRRQTIYDAVDIDADAPLPFVNMESAANFRPIEESKPSVIRRQTTYDAVDIVAKAALPPANRRTNKRESIYTPTDIIEESPVKLKSCSGPTEISSNTVQDPPNDTKIQKRRDSIHTPTDIVEESPKASRTNENVAHSEIICKPAARLSVYTASDMIEDSPKPPPKLPTRTQTSSEIIEDSTKDLKSPPRIQPPQAGKIIVKHMSLQKDLTANQVALRVLKNKPTEVEHISNDSFMDMSIPCEPTVSEHKMNFYQLNEKMLRGETKAFAKSAAKMSLFDRLEQNPPELTRFDSFMDKSNATDCIIQPAKNLIKDNTIDLTMQRATDTFFGKQFKSLLDPSLNPSQGDDATNWSSVADCKAAGSKIKRQTVHMSENLLEETKSSSSFPSASASGGQKNRQTIYFNHGNEIEESLIDRQTPSPFDDEPSSSQRSKANLAGEVELDETATDEPKLPSNVRNENSNRKHKTINFNENGGDMKESVLEMQKPSNVLVKASVSLDEPTMDLSMQETNPQASQINLNQGKYQRKRLTIHFNENAELDESLCEEPKPWPIAKKLVESNLNPTLDISVEVPSAQDYQVTKTSISNLKKRQTIHFNENNELEESVTYQQKPIFGVRNTTVCYDDPTMHLSMQSCSKQAHQLGQNLAAGRQTINFNENIEESFFEQSAHLHIPVNAGSLRGLTVQRSNKPSFHNLQAEQEERQTMHLEASDEFSTQRSHRSISNEMPTYKNFGLEYSTRKPSDLAKQITFGEPSLGQLNQENLSQKGVLGASLCRNISNAATKTSAESKDDDTMDISLIDPKKSMYQAQGQTIDSNQYEEPVGMTVCHQTIPKSSGAPYRQAAEEQSLSMQPSAHQDLKADKDTNRTLVQSKRIAESEFGTAHSSLLTNKRHTLHLHQDMEYDEQDNQMENLLTAKPKPQRQTIHFNQNNDLEESTTHFKNEEHLKGIPKPRRLTALDSQESPPQQLTARKFSRTLNFNTTPTTSVDMDLSLVQEQTQTKSKNSQPAPVEDSSPLNYFNANSKTLETTTDIDRSLAEYLKAEAAATLFRNSSMAKECRSISPEEVFYDAVESFAEEQPQQLAKICEVTQDPGNFLEESGMQPLTKSAETSVDAGEKMLRTLAVAENKENIQPENEYTIPTEQKVPVRSTAMLENSMETSILPKEQAQPSTKPKETLCRKTMHFTDENAVDESFFDEKQTNPKLRHTLYFNEPGNPSADMDTDRTFSKSKAVESVREMLRESLFLFNKFKQPKSTALENKRLTTVFSAAGMDITTPHEPMECESPRGSAENEGTPTKNRQSRIPQLIGSAKKLESMWKSMEFIQQELPNLGCRGEHTPEKNTASNDFVEDPGVAETPQRAAANSLSLAAYRCGSTDKQKNYEDYFNARGMKQRVTSYEPKNLEESFETVEIPRRVTSYAARNIPGSPVVTEIPDKDIDEELKPIDDSLETVDILRRVSNFHKNETLRLCPDQLEVSTTHRKSLYQCDDAPITVSDVSTYFAQNRLSRAERTIAPTSPNTTEALCNLDVDCIVDESQLPRSTDSNDATHTNLANFQKLYVELTCDSIMLEKTHLSLINTLDEASELEPPPSVRSPMAASELEAPSARPSEAAAVDVVDVAPPVGPFLKPVSSVCRKCKKHRLSVTQNETTIGSFMMETDPEPEPILDFSELYELAKKPKIRHGVKFWRQKLRESDSFTISDDSQSIAPTVRAKLDSFVAELEQQRLENAQQRQKEREAMKSQVSFLDTLRKGLQNRPNWILNEPLVAGNFLRFSHTQIRTFAILIKFTEKDHRGIEVNFTDIQVGPNMFHKRGQWSPFEYALHYQLLVELPFDLRKLCPNSDRLFEMLDHIEEVIQSVLQTGKDMLHLVLTSPASLIREPSGVLYIRKYARTKSPQSGPKRTEFQIQVRNIRKLSFESIILPPLYEFDEKIQLLPVGLDFLRKFLAEPMGFMKT